MALKVGTENKRNVIIVAVLGCVLVYLLVTQVFGGSSTPKPNPVIAQPTTLRQAPVAPRTSSAGTVSAGKLEGPAARKIPGSGLDPSLHTEKLAASESIEYAGRGRNIFSGESAPVQIEQPMKTARVDVPVGPVIPPPYVAPQPPAIDLKYFGYTTSKSGVSQAFLLHGDDIFEAGAGEIVNHRYKVVAVNEHGVQITDLSYNNTQTLPLTN